jgi:hypothetical protein
MAAPQKIDQQHQGTRSDYNIGVGSPHYLSWRYYPVIRRLYRLSRPISIIHAMTEEAARLDAERNLITELCLRWKLSRWLGDRSGAPAAVFAGESEHPLGQGKHSRYTLPMPTQAPKLRGAVRGFDFIIFHAHFLGDQSGHGLV